MDNEWNRLTHAFRNVYGCDNNGDTQTDYSLSFHLTHKYRYKQTVTLTVSGFVVIQALLFILWVNILSLRDPV